MREHECARRRAGERHRRKEMKERKKGKEKGKRVGKDSLLYAHWMRRISTCATVLLHGTLLMNTVVQELRDASWKGWGMREEVGKGVASRLEPAGIIFLAFIPVRRGWVARVSLSPRFRQSGSNLRYLSWFPFSLSISLPVEEWR